MLQQELLLDMLHMLAMLLGMLLGISEKAVLPFESYCLLSSFIAFVAIVDEDLPDDCHWLASRAGSAGSI